MNLGEHHANVFATMPGDVKDAPFGALHEASALFYIERNAKLDVTLLFMRNKAKG
jgi:hypothetical protein